MHPIGSIGLELSQADLVAVPCYWTVGALQVVLGVLKAVGERRVPGDGTRRRFKDICQGAPADPSQVGKTSKTENLSSRSDPSNILAWKSIGQLICLKSGQQNYT